MHSVDISPCQETLSPCDEIPTLLGVVEGKMTHCPNSFRAKTTELTVQVAFVLFLSEQYQKINYSLALFAKYKHFSLSSCLYCTKYFLDPNTRSANSHHMIPLDHLLALYFACHFTHNSHVTTKERNLPLYKGLDYIIESSLSLSQFIITIQDLINTHYISVP